MPERKINDSVMLAMLDKGKKQAEVAEFFGVSPQAISDGLKKLRGGIVKVAVMETAAKAIDKNLNAAAQLQKINKDANEILDLLMRWNRGDKAALQVLESQVRKVRVGKTKKLVEKFKFKDPRELALSAMGEIRSQLKLQLEIFQTLYDMKAVQEFQQEVLSAIAEASPEVRDAIISKLNQRRIIRRSIQLD